LFGKSEIVVSKYLYRRGIYALKFFLSLPQDLGRTEVIDQLAYVLVAAGGVMFFLSFLGYCGALRESQCLLTTVSRDSYK
jgi:Tetraspanin family